MIMGRKKTIKKRPEQMHFYNYFIEFIRLKEWSIMNNDLVLKST